jgi:hypothetical protein
MLFYPPYSDANRPLVTAGERGMANVSNYLSKYYEKAIHSGRFCWPLVQDLLYARVKDYLGGAISGTGGKWK